ncbi:MAG: RsmE family RNA methyltransferase [Limisphaerales bacterium]
MHRFLVSEVRHPAVLPLPETEALHASRVLRLRTGDPVTLLDGAGGEVTGTVERCGRPGVDIRTTGLTRHPMPRTRITLLQSVAKGPAMEGLIHRAVELGAHRLVPLVTDRSVSRPDAAGDKQTRWQTIAREALKQSGNPWLMTVEPPETLTAWWRRREAFDLVLIASLLDEPRPLLDHLSGFQRTHGRLPGSVALVVGPEGDFTPQEYGQFREAGALSFSLGPLVLRVETATTAALAVLQAGLASLGSTASSDQTFS